MSSEPSETKPCGHSVDQAVGSERDHEAPLARAASIDQDKERERRQRLAAVVFEHAAESIIVTDAEARIEAVNPAFTRSTGYRADEVIGRNPSLLQSGRHDERFYQALWQRLAETGCWSGEIWNRRKSGYHYLEWMSINQVLDDAGRCVNYVAISSDLTELRRSAAEIDYLQRTDALTGLANSAQLRCRLAEMVESAVLHGRALAVIYVDIDHYKDVVASYGHGVGEELLREIARRLVARCAKGGLVARLGDDTFVMVALADASEASALAVALQEHCSAAVALPGCERLSITISIGVALCPDDADEVDELLRIGSSALLQAKLSGRQSVAFHQPEATRRAMRRLHVETGLRDAIESGELELVYQPIVNAATGVLSSAEALLRWRRDGRLLEPVDFIDIVEASDLALPIGHWVLETAFDQVCRWAADGLPAVPVLVNAAARQISSGALVSGLRRLLAAQPEAAQLIGIEVVERVLLRDPEQAAEQLHQVRALGVGIALDDFGTGYSSLGYLSRFPVDRVKIDRSFVQTLASDVGAAAVVRATLSIARDLHIRVVAEGVETEAELQLLTRDGCDLVQGYLVSHPLPATEFAALLGRDSEPPWRERFLPSALGLPGRNILLLTDVPREREPLLTWLAESGWHVLVPSSLQEAFQLAAAADVPVALIEQRVLGSDGVDLAARLRELYPEIRRLLMLDRETEHCSLDAVNRGGVFGVLPDPQPSEELRAMLKSAYQARREWPWKAGEPSRSLQEPPAGSPPDP
jgi:diguanylate cyclase (GGDEF)-like protein/PAS domain S-box-containing protein